MDSQASRSPSPHYKLQRATATIDEITKALAEFSRSTTPEPLGAPFCSCCDKDSCETSTSWTRDRSNIEKRLVLSAEIGQALLERHEAYVADHSRLYTRSIEKCSALERSNEQVVSRMADLIKAKDNTDKRLAQATVNLEVAEASNRALLREVQEARAVITRLSATVARSAGWEDRLATLALERDDMRQERDGETMRARSLEMKAAAMSVKCESLQAEVYRLLDQINDQHSPDREFSEELLRDARARLDMLYSSMGQASVSENPEITLILEKLVADGEALKRDNAELQNLLTESRSELRALTEEVQEYRAGVSAIHPVDTVLKSGSPPMASSLHHHNRRIVPSLIIPRGNRRQGEGWAASFAASSPPPYHLGFSRASSPQLRSFPLSRNPADEDARSSIPSDNRDESPGAGSSDRRLPRSFSPGGSIATSNTKHTTMDPSSTANSVSHNNNTEMDSDVFSDTQFDEFPDMTSPAKPRKRSLVLLSRSRAVQTDLILERRHIPILSPSDGRSTSSGPDRDTSETSSLHVDPASAGQMVPPPIPELVEKLTALLARVNQADIQTLTARLKRQHLAGDVGHLSRTTINSIMSDVAALRNHFRAALDVERHAMTRKDLRSLLTFSKDVFAELGRLRSTVNDVTLDPSSAIKLGVASSAAIETRDLSGMAMGWMAPISKLFTPNIDVTETSQGIGRTNEHAGPSSPRRRLPTRQAPKLAPAVSSSAATVNVEFTSSRSKRAFLSTMNTHDNGDSSSQAAASSGRLTPAQPEGSGSTRGKPRRDDLFGIFAGAPRSVNDSWVVIPDKTKSPSRLRNSSSTANFGNNNGSLRAPRASRNRLSRNVDAIIDNIGQRGGTLSGERGSMGDTIEEDDRHNDDPDFQPTALERTRALHSRGLSDSSIHSTFLAAPVNHLLTPAGLALSSPVAAPTLGEGSFGTYDRQSVMRALSQKVQSFAAGYYPAPGPMDSNKLPASPACSQVPLGEASPPRPIPTKSRNRSSMSPARPGINDITASSAAPSAGRLPAISRLLPTLSTWVGSHVEGELGDPTLPRGDDAFDRHWGRDRERL